MQPIATHTVSHLGQGKYICLYHGDLSAIPANEAVDLLVVSAFPNDYAPTPSSVIGSLHRKGVSLLELSRDKEVDLRSTFSCWSSRELSKRFPDAGFRRIVCFESAQQVPPAERVGDIFRAIMPFVLADPPIRSIAMPILGAGDQRHDAAVMLSAIFDASAHWLAAGLPVDVIKIVVHNRAAVLELTEVFSTLKRRRTLPQGSSSGVKQEDAEYHLFVSYAHEDILEVDGLIAELRSANPTLRIFQDKIELKAGESWQSELDRALESCCNVVAVYSPSYLASKMCLEEFNMARVRHRESPTPVITPIYLRTAAHLPLYMRTLQYIDCREADRTRLRAAAEELVAASAISERTHQRKLTFTS